MSQFFDYSEAGRVEKMRRFLNLKLDNFSVSMGLRPVSAPPGRPARYPREAVKKIESLVNAKAAIAESPRKSIGERIALARDYMGYSNADIARRLGLSREWVRRWVSNERAPGKYLDCLARALEVTEAWLAHGDHKTLPANCRVGVRVGDESLSIRTRLFVMTHELFDDMENMLFESQKTIQLFIETAVFDNPEMREAARQAGGRWQYMAGCLLFAPWIPLPLPDLTRRCWSDQVEDVIQRAVDSHPTVYSAWKSIKEECESKGISEYPKLITLHKRIEKARRHFDRYGITFALEE